MILTLIAAVSDNGVIGAKGRLPWHVPADLKRFKDLTMGHSLILGRKTFESIGTLLPGRRIIVVSRRQDYAPEGVIVRPSLEEALLQCPEEDKVFIGGGAEIYALALPLADEMFLTFVHCYVDGDAFFPPVDESRWRKLSVESHASDEANSYAYSFVHYQRIADPSSRGKT